MLEHVEAPRRRDMRTLILITLSLAFMQSSASAQWASLKGRFVYGGEGTKVPSAMKLNVTKDLQVCGKEDLFNEQLTINPENRGISNILVWAYKPKVVHESFKKTAADVIKMDNKLCRFDPHAVVVRTGQTLQVGNPDPVAHNSMITFLKNTPENPLIPANGKVDFRPTKAEIIPVKVSCSIHPWMQGIVLVQDHPYMAVTDKDGKFEIKNLPAGKLTLKVWHEKAGYIQEVKLDGKTAKWKRGRYALNVKDGKDMEHEYIVDPKAFKK